MLTVLKKNWLISLIVGIALIVAGVLFVFVLPEIGESIKNYTIAALLIVLLFLLVLPDLQKTNTKLVKTLLMVEIIIVLLAAAMFVFAQSGNQSFWIGLIIYTHGTIDLIGGYFSGKKQRAERFFISLLLVSVGVYIYAANVIGNSVLMNLLLVVFVALGVFFLYYGLTGMQKSKKK